jgi:methylated-DNA-[protein]-cysteine S-methyltransferase
MKIFFHETEIGRMGIAEDEGSITNVYFETDAVPENTEICETPVIREAFLQLKAYLAGELKSFSLPIAPEGTEFMQAMWRRLGEIHYGQKSSYKDIAAAAGNPQGARAVGLACNRNPIPIFIPCHRVVGSDGKLTGYRGGLALKERLLELEARQ